MDIAGNMVVSATAQLPHGLCHLVLARRFDLIWSF
jgi:hypothetical protein